MSDYTIVNLSEVEDFAGKYGFGEAGEVRFPREALAAERTGFAHMRLRAGRRSPVPHRHHDAEEICIVLAGSGTAKLDDELRELQTHDMLRLSPRVARQFEAGPEGMELLVFGARHEDDGERLADFWSE
ncbi:MAG TPA: cupin domain-containing protein [Solirubrobacteraceae bacterium]